MTLEQRKELVERVYQCIFEEANQNPFNPDALKEANAVVDQIVAPLVETLEKVVCDYNGLISLCQTYGLHATKKDAIETVEYIEEILNGKKEKSA